MTSATTADSQLPYQRRVPTTIATHHRGRTPANHPPLSPPHLRYMTVAQMFEEAGLQEHDEADTARSPIKKPGLGFGGSAKVAPVMPGAVEGAAGAAGVAGVAPVPAPVPASGAEAPALAPAPAPLAPAVAPLTPAPAPAPPASAPPGPAPAPVEADPAAGRAPSRVADDAAAAVAMGLAEGGKIVVGGVVAAAAITGTA